MEKIRFLNDYTVYNGKLSFGNNIVTICFDTALPPESVLTNGFELLNENNGFVQGHYELYNTVYRTYEDNELKIDFSCDGSVYTPPVPTISFASGFGGDLEGELSQSATNYADLIIPTPIAEENYIFAEWNPEIKESGDIDENMRFTAVFQYVPTMDEIRENKMNEISSACEQTIYAGIDVTLPNGTEHFSLTEKDQINLFGKQAQLAAGLDQLEYHQDGHPCRYYSAEEMQQIISDAMFHVSYHTTYCNSLNMWTAGADSAEEINSIFYGAAIPEEYQSEVLKDYLAKIAE